MATKGPGQAPQAPSLTSLPRVEDLPTVPKGFDQDRVRDAFESYRRHATQLQVQLRVLQAAAGSGQFEPTGHAVRMDALHMIRAAAEMADTIERDAQTASATQLRRTEEEISRRQRDAQDREAQVERYRAESERQRAELMNAARSEIRELQTDTNRQTSQEIQEAEARAARLLEQARHQATELTNAARAEVEQTLEWARAQASAVMARAQEGAEQLLTAAGMGDEAIGRVVEAIVEAAQTTTEAARAPSAAKAPPAVTPTAASRISAPIPARPEAAPGDVTPPGKSSDKPSSSASAAAEPDETGSPEDGR